MRIIEFYAQGIYPLEALEQEDYFRLSLLDEEGLSSERVLLMGISGTGKSTTLRCMADTYCLLARWAMGKPCLEESLGSCALLLEGMVGEKVLVIRAKQQAFWHAMAGLHPDALAVGYVGSQAQGKGDARAQALIRLVLDEQNCPNMLLLEEEEPLGEKMPGVHNSLCFTWADIRLYMAASGGVVGALSALRERDTRQYMQMIGWINGLLVGKGIDSQDGLVHLNRGGTHAISGLSGGEKRALHLLFAVFYALHTGGILLVDEPEMHLHPSQVLGLLDTLERLTEQKRGQFILTSHTPQVWQRYENLGVVVALEGSV